VHGLGDRDELDLAVEGDQREARRAGGIREDRRHVAVVRAELEHDARRADPGQLRHEPGEQGGVVRPAGARRQQQLAAFEQPRDVGAVGDVDPSHGGAEGVAADDHDGRSGGEHRQGEHLRHGRQNRRRTFCPGNVYIVTNRHLRLPHR